MGKPVGQSGADLRWTGSSTLPRLHHEMNLAGRFSRPVDPQFDPPYRPSIFPVGGTRIVGIARRFILYPVRKVLYRRVGPSWIDCPDPQLAALQKTLRRRPGVLDAFVELSPNGFESVMIEMVLDSSIDIVRAVEASEVGVSWVLANIGDWPCTVLVWDEGRIQVRATGRYLSGTQEITWTGPG